MLLNTVKHSAFGLRPLCLSLLLGAGGLWLGFPNDFVHIPPLVLLYPVMLAHLGERCQSASEAFRCAWLVGIVGCSGVLYWLAVPVHTVAALPWALALPCAVAIAMYVAFYGAVFCAAAHVFYKRYMYYSFGIVRVCVALSCLWCLLEYLRGWAFTGFPWMVLSTAFAPWPVMIQGASIVGAYVLSAFFVCMSLLFLEGARQYVRRSIDGRGTGLMLCALGMLGAVISWGCYVLYVQAPPQHKEAHARVLMVEGNIDQNQKWELSNQEKTLQTYMTLTERGLAQMSQEVQGTQTLPTLVIWPETAMPFYIEHHPRLGRELLRFVSQTKRAFIIGAPGAERVADNEAHKENAHSDVEIFNRAYFVNARGHLESFYDKSQLVPFGEYVPHWLALDFLKPLLQGIGDFTLGRATHPLRVDNLSLGVLICYEGVFPELARQRVADGANVLLNISNDGWFGDSSAAEQHLHLSLMRTVEQGRWLVRSTNTGISAIIDAQGRVVVKGGQFQAQSVAGFVQAFAEKTFFYALQPYLVLVALAVFVVLCVVPSSRRRRSLW